MLLLQVQLNNSLNVITELSLNEIIYECKIKKLILLLFTSVVINVVVDTTKNIFNQQLKYQRKIVDVTIFANIKVKIYYNVKH